MLLRFAYRIHSMRLALKVFLGAILWTSLISYLHYELNYDHGDVKTVTIGYMPVVTNLAVPILDHVSHENDDIRFKALKYASFAEMGEALRNGELDVAFMIAPLSIVLRQQGEDVKVIYIGNRHESTLVTRKELHVNSIQDLSGKTVAVPMRYSGHNLSILEVIEKHGLTGQVNVVEMNPPDMASALSSGSLDAYYVGEPFAAQTVKNGYADKLFYVEDVWKYFICNLAVVRQEYIARNSETLKVMVQAAARSGIWAQKHPEEAAAVAASYWNQPLDLVEYTLTHPENRTVYDHFIPREEEMQHMANLMKKYDLIKHNDITGLVEDKFATAADVSGVSSMEDILIY